MARLSVASIATWLIAAIAADPNWEEKWGKPESKSFGTDGNISIGFGAGLYQKNAGDQEASQEQSRAQIVAEAVILSHVEAAEKHFGLPPYTLRVSHYFRDQEKKANIARFQVAILKSAIMGEGSERQGPSVQDRLTDESSKLMAKMGAEAMSFFKEMAGMSDAVQLSMVQHKLKALGAPETETQTEDEIPV